MSSSSASDAEYVPPEELTTKQKAIYASGSLSGMFFASFTGQIQAFYYTWMGLGIKYILIGQILYGIWNLVNDPIFGVMQDRTKTKSGRYIPWIKWFSGLFTLAFIVLFLPPQVWRYQTGGEEYQIALAIWYLLSQMLYDTFFTIVYLAHVALAPQMTMNQKERTDLAIWATVMTVIGMGASSAFPLLFLTNPTVESIRNFQICVIVYGILALIPWVLITKYIKEKPEFLPEVDVGFWESVKCVFRNPSGRIYMIYDGISVGILNGVLTAITYLFAWVFGLNEHYAAFNDGEWNFFTALPYLAVIPVGILVGIWWQLNIPKKHDVKTALLVSLLLEAVGFIIAYVGIVTSSNLTETEYVLPENLWLVAVGLFIAMMGFPGDFLYHNVMRADTIDFDELLTGERRESVYAGVGCVLSKPMQSVALATVPLLMSIYGLVPASPDDPTDTALVVRDGYASAVIGVATAAFLFAAILAIIGVITWLWYPLDRAAIADMRTRLRDMHEKKRVERLSQDGTSKFVER